MLPRLLRFFVLGTLCDSWVTGRLWPLSRQTFVLEDGLLDIPLNYSVFLFYFCVSSLSIGLFGLLLSLFLFSFPLSNFWIWFIFFLLIVPSNLFLDLLLGKFFSLLLFLWFMRWINKSITALQLFARSRLGFFFRLQNILILLLSNRLCDPINIIEVINILLELFLLLLDLLYCFSLRRLLLVIGTLHLPHFLTIHLDDLL